MHTVLNRSSVQWSVEIKALIRNEVLWKCTQVLAQDFMTTLGTVTLKEENEIETKFDKTLATIQCFFDRTCKEIARCRLNAKDLKHCRGTRRPHESPHVSGPKEESCRWCKLIQISPIGTKVRFQRPTNSSDSVPAITLQDACPVSGSSFQLKWTCTTTPSEGYWCYLLFQLSSSGLVQLEHWLNSLVEPWNACPQRQGNPRQWHRQTNDRKSKTSGWYHLPVFVEDMSRKPSSRLCKPDLRWRLPRLR